LPNAESLTSKLPSSTSLTSKLPTAPNISLPKIGGGT
jgi:hypothetical protein